jgi:DNA polymerase I-like protein with 3'-5' exonuclease and polymerase domains
MRSDALGLFWEDFPLEKERNAARQQHTRPIPPIPETGWTMPKDFPRLDAAKEISIDIETYDPDLLAMGPGVRRDGRLAGLAIGTEDAQWYFPVGHAIGSNMDCESVVRWADQELTRPNQPKVGANLLYDLDYLLDYGVEVAGPFYDVQNAEPLLDENARSYSLDTLALKYLGEGKHSNEMYEWAELAYGGGRPAANIYRCPPQLVGPYAMADARLPLQILKKQRIRLERQGLLPVFEMESALIPLLLAMRRRGVRINPTGIERVITQMDAQAELLQAQLKGVRINSPADLAALCKREGIEYELSPKGAPSFRADWLRIHGHPLIHAVAELRKIMKSRDTFIKGYLLKYGINDRVHALFNQLRSDTNGTISGRFSSSNPNLQNIPSRDDIIGPLIRSLYLPEEDEDWYRLDWSQIEFRLLVHYGRGKGAAATRQAYLDDPTTDFHAWVQELIWPGQPHMRKTAKNINFGLVYGMGAKTLAMHLGRSLQSALPIFDQYHTRLPFVKVTYDKASETAQNSGIIKTIYGRRRHFDQYEQNRYGEMQRAYTHKALNAVLQGSAADLMKIAMVQIWESGVCDVLGAPLLTVHDELDWSVPRTAAGREAILEVKHIMETCYELRVPIIADMESGPSWGECTK